MPRTVIAPIATVNPNLDAGAAVVWTAADPVNDNAANFRQGMFLLARNGGASGHTVTITSAPDALGRTNDISTDALAAGATKVYGPFERHGWRQSDGRLYFRGSNAEVTFAALWPG